MGRLRCQELLNASAKTRGIFHVRADPGAAHDHFYLPRFVPREFGVDRGGVEPPSLPHLQLFDRGLGYAITAYQLRLAHVPGVRLLLGRQSVPGHTRFVDRPTVGLGNRKRGVLTSHSCMTRALKPSEPVKSLNELAAHSFIDV